jgi:hypothetical protein
MCFEERTTTRIFDASQPTFPNDKRVLLQRLGWHCRLLSGPGSYVIPADFCKEVNGSSWMYADLAKSVGMSRMFGQDRLLGFLRGFIAPNLRPEYWFLLRLASTIQWRLRIHPTLLDNKKMSLFSKRPLGLDVVGSTSPHPRVRLLVPPDSSLRTILEAVNGRKLMRRSTPPTA